MQHIVLRLQGKLVDLLTERHEIVVRYQGGANAGHTVVVGPETYKLSLIPSGILTPNVQCVITGGVVIKPQTLLEEIDALVAGRGRARAEKNWAEADRIRDALAERGIEILDAKDGSRWRRS